MNNGFKILLGIVALYVGGFFVRSNTSDLKFFRPAEFGVWFPLMDPELLARLDKFRLLLDSPVKISPAPGALGRPSSPTSQHFPNPLVGAADVMIQDDIDFHTAYRAARSAGFTGIGLYPDWKPSRGLHLDVRSDRTVMNPATWTGFNDFAGNQIYAGIDKALGDRLA